MIYLRYRYTTQKHVEAQPNQSCACGEAISSFKQHLGQRRYAPKTLPFNDGAGDVDKPLLEVPADMTPGLRANVSGEVPRAKLREAIFRSDRLDIYSTSPFSCLSYGNLADVDGNSSLKRSAFAIRL